jgi:hypothetical protein
VTPVFALVGAALGIGALVPRFERRASMSIERAHPSMVALLAFTMGAMVVGGVGFGLLWWTRTTASLGPAALAWLASLGVLAASGGGNTFMQFGGTTISRWTTSEPVPGPVAWRFESGTRSDAGLSPAG